MKLTGEEAVSVLNRTYEQLEFALDLVETDPDRVNSIISELLDDVEWLKEDYFEVEE